MPETAIVVENLSKRYRIGERVQKQDTLGGAVVDLLARPARNLRRLRRLSRFSRDGEDQEDVIWALRDVSFEVKEGEVVGIIGRNGAGKSALLKILSGITEPTKGRAVIKGRVASLLEVGTGFHAELTGRENVYLNGTILGMTRKEIDRKFDEIVDFAGFEDFIDTPVKRYSSGMKVRLAFSVAAHLEPEILLVDEVLAVGDAEFQRKSLGKMGEVGRGGRTVLFVSHNMGAISSLCDTAYWIEEGEVRSRGTVKGVVTDYLSSTSASATVPLAERKDRGGNGQLRFTSISIEDSSGRPLGSAQVGQDMQFRLEYSSRNGSRLQNVGVDLKIVKATGEDITALTTETAGYSFEELPGDGQIVCRIPSLPLLPGMYGVTLWGGVKGATADVVNRAADFEVVEGDFFGSGKLPKSRHGDFLIAHSWELLKAGVKR